MPNELMSRFLEKYLNFLNCTILDGEGGGGYLFCTEKSTNFQYNHPKIVFMYHYHQIPRYSPMQNKYNFIIKSEVNHKSIIIRAVKPVNVHETRIFNITFI